MCAVCVYVCVCVCTCVCTVCVYVCMCVYVYMCVCCIVCVCTCVCNHNVWIFQFVIYFATPLYDSIATPLYGNIATPLYDIIVMPLLPRPLPYLGLIPPRGPVTSTEKYHPNIKMLSLDDCDRDSSSPEDMEQWRMPTGTVWGQVALSAHM